MGKARSIEPKATEHYIYMWLEQGANPRRMPLLTRGIGPLSKDIWDTESQMRQQWVEVSAQL
jgi:hypothetical protein